MSAICWESKPLNMYSGLLRMYILLSCLSFLLSVICSMFSKLSISSIPSIMMFWAGNTQLYYTCIHLHLLPSPFYFSSAEDFLIFFVGYASIRVLNICLNFLILVNLTELTYCRYARTFAFFYTIGLHILVFTCLYRMSALSHLRYWDLTNLNFLSACFCFY